MFKTPVLITLKSYHRSTVSKWLKMAKCGSLIRSQNLLVHPLQLSRRHWYYPMLSEISSDMKEYVECILSEFLTRINKKVRANFKEAIFHYFFILLPATKNEEEKGTEVKVWELKMVANQVSAKHKLTNWRKRINQDKPCPCEYFFSIDLVKL